MSEQEKIKIFAYIICVIISIIFTIITVSEYGRKHEKMTWYRTVLVASCVFILAIIGTFCTANLIIEQ